MSKIKRKFKLHKNSPAQRIEEMCLCDLLSLKEKAEAMANACGYADEGTKQDYWIGVENTVNERIEQLKQVINWERKCKTGNHLSQSVQKPTAT